ncbi:hypothetical protein [Bradyrhizobium sp. JYMT SZCCT0428]|uniref:hypothetical protein n=1 Tax=Bradyrhizobium sp. JYMT SZCCT0428 TaxID=2807673 RepID=UPI001BACA261|nr:hypothetical protein [Bradyrhizobium sp. JYMT SZCCT0428]MBR1151205.1 hypothetical protein [Bradyrhizobium sp. JYMT SZCCT0428]
MLPILMALTSFGPASSRDAGKTVDRDSVVARNVRYEVRESPSEKGHKCLYRDERQMLCPGTAFIAFEKHHKTRNYDLIVISMGELGSGTRWWDWKLIIESGKQAVIKPLANQCLECEIKIERLEVQLNEIIFSYRQEQRLISVRFHSGQLTMRKSKLDAREPLDEDTCGMLFGNYEECRSTERNPADCTMAHANSSHFSILRAEDRYAGISYGSLQRLCKAACSTGKAMGRTAFFKKVCRR